MDWTANGWTIVGLIVAVFGAAFSGGAYRWTDHYKARLKTEPPIQDKAAKALTAPGPHSAYLRALEAALDKLTGWMGQRARLLSKDDDRGEWVQSAGLCFTLAMIYPFVFLLTSWLFGGTGKIGAFEFLPPPESQPIWQRASLVLLFLAYCAVMYLLVRNAERIDGAVKAWLDRHLWQHFPAPHQKKAKALLPIGIGAFIFGILYVGLGLPLDLALAIALAGAAALAGAVALAGAGAVALPVAVALALPGAVAVAVAIAVAVALAEGAAANTFSATFFLFFLLLPFINAIFDWASWQVSRWLGDNLLTISKERSYPRWKRAGHYLKDIVIDGGFALACLIGLAWAIPRVIEAFNGLMNWLSGEQIFVIADYLCAAAKEPLGDGLWATAMLFSTLLPTAIHFSFLIFAPIFWGISWLFGAHITNRARAAHLTHGTRPPKKDIKGDGSAVDKWPRAMPTNYGLQGLREEQSMFEDPLNPTTLHRITIELRVLRPLYYTAALGLILATLWLYAAPAIAAITGPLPASLLWVAHNFDRPAVQACFAG